MLTAAIAAPLILRAAALYADRRENRVRGGVPALAAPAGLPYADLHMDALLWNRDFMKEHSHGQVDLPRMRRGGVGVQFFSVVTHSPYGINIDHNRSDALDLVTLLEIGQWRPPKTWWSRRERALDRARQLSDAARRSGGLLTVVHTREELAEVFAAPEETRPVAGILSIEGGAPLEGSPANVAVLFDAGFRMFSLSHFVDTDLAGSAHGETRGGLSPAGRAVLAEMEKRGVILDLAHGSAALFDEALKEWPGPVLVSHTGVRATCDNARNLTDGQLKAVARRGGIIGIGFWKQATCGEGLAAVAGAVVHAVQVAGPKAISLGSDFDGAVTEPSDVTGLPALAAELKKHGLTDGQVAGVMGENARRFLLENLPARPR